MPSGSCPLATGHSPGCRPVGARPEHPEARAPGHSPQGPAPPPLLGPSRGAAPRGSGSLSVGGEAGQDHSRRVTGSGGFIDSRHEPALPAADSAGRRGPRTRTRTSSSGLPCQTSPRCSSSSRPRRAGPAPGGRQRRLRPSRPVAAPPSPAPPLGRGSQAAHLLGVLLLDLLQVGPQVHAHLVLGAQQGLEHGVGRHAHPPQRRPLELASQVEQLLVHVLQLQGWGGLGSSGRARGPGAPPLHKAPRPLTSLVLFCTFISMSYFSSSATSILACSCLQSSWSGAGGSLS